MDPEQGQETVVGKANANISSWILEDQLYYVLTDLLSLKLDT